MGYPSKEDKHVFNCLTRARKGREQAATPTPKKLRQRLDQSWLVQMPSPRLPPVDIGLYRRLVDALQVRLNSVKLSSVENQFELLNLEESAVAVRRTPTTMNAKMQGAFKGIMPPTAIMAASHMHGVREAYHHKCPRKRYTIGFDERLPQYVLLTRPVS